MSLSFLEEYGPGLISNGYKIIPIKRGSKAPAVKGWPKIDADQNQLEKWISAGHEGVGILCKNNPAVDIDVLDEEVCSQMVDAVLQEYPGGLVRVGRAPKTLLAYRTDKPFKKVRSSTYKDLSGKRHAVEILADGQQYVAYAIHPDTNQPYQWNGKDIADVDSNDLPIIRYEDALKVVEIFEQIAQEKILSDGWTKIEGGASGKSTEANDKKNGSDSTELAGISNLKPTLDITDQEVKADLACLCAYDYKRWINVGMALHHQYKGSPEGFDIWDDWSQTSNKYPHEDPSEIPLQGKWSSFSKKGDGEVITFASVKWWVNDKRGGIDPLEEFLERYIYIAEGDCVHDLYGLPHNKPLEMKEFRNMTENIRIVKEIPAPIATNSDRTVEKEFPVHKLWLKSCERKTAMAFSYLPGGPRILRDSDDQLYINKFNMPAFVNPCLKIYENGETKMYQEEIDSLLKIFFRHIE